MGDRIRKKRIFLFLFFAISLILLACLAKLYCKKTPFEWIDVSQVEGVDVLYGAYKRELTQEQVITLVDLLKQIVLIGDETDDFLEYDGCIRHQFHIKLKTGIEFELAISNPFCIFNGKQGYRCEYQTAVEVMDFYSSLVDEF